MDPEPAQAGKLALLLERVRAKSPFGKSRREAARSTGPQPSSSTQPSSTQPSSTQPSSTQPSSTQPSSTQPSSTQTSPDRDLWKVTVERASGKTKEWVTAQGYSDSDGKPASEHIRDIVDLVKQKESDYNDKSFKIEVGGHKIIFREYVADVIGFLTTAGDVAVAFAPPQASAPWGLVKAVLQIPVKGADQICTILGVVEKIVRNIRRGQVYEVLYLTEDAQEDVVRNVRDDLLDLYAASLDLLAEAGYSFTKGTISITLHAILNPKKAENNLKAVIENEEQLSRDVQACEARRSANDRKEILDFLTKMNSPLTRVEEEVKITRQKIEKLERERMFSDISSEPFGLAHENVQGSRVNGTGEWLLRHEDFGDWERASFASTILWLRGNVGFGKTYLTSRVIDHVRGRIGKTEGFAYFYCRRKGAVPMDPMTVLRSYVCQLYQGDSSSGEVPEKLVEKWEETKNNGTKNLSYAVCKELIVASINRHPRTTLILDALDECDDEEVHNLAAAFNDVVKLSAKPVRVFVSSRPRETTKLLEDNSAIVIDIKENERDIQEYLKTNLYDTGWYRKRSEDLRLEVDRFFTSHGQRMFLLVSLQVSALKKCVTAAAIRDRLNEMPKTPVEAYDQILKSMEKRHPVDFALAERALKWMICSYHPLKVDALLEAVQLKPQEGNLEKVDKPTKENLLTLCQDFITIDSRRDVWEFSHLSVVEYLETKGFSMRDADLLVAQASLHLLFETFSTIDPDITLKRYKRRGLELADPKDTTLKRDLDNFNTLKHPLQIYIQHHWPRHVRRYEDASQSNDINIDLCRLLKKFLGSLTNTSLPYRRWITLYGRTLDSIFLPRWPATSVFHTIDIKSLSPQHPNTDGHALLAMCVFDFDSILQDWWESKDIDIAARIPTVDGWEPLALAAMAGSIPICKYLIGKLDVNFLLEHLLGNALVAAIYKRQFETAKFLIREGKAEVNVEVAGWCDETALAAAVETGSIEFVKWLVEEAGAEVNLKSTSFTGSALAKAAKCGDLVVAKYLLHRGADVNALLQGEYGSPLAAAACSRSTNRLEMVGFLIDNGAEVDLQLISGNYGSALEAAARGDRPVEACKYLIEHGASVNLGLKKGRYGSALISALCQVQVSSAASFLLEVGASMTQIYSTGDFGSALAAAAFWGHKELLQRTVNDIGWENAMETLRQSRHPQEEDWGMRYMQYHVDSVMPRRAKTAIYLVEDLGLDLATLDQIGLKRPWNSHLDGEKARAGRG